jgi:hypothetical protein
MPLGAIWFQISEQRGAFCSNPTRTFEEAIPLRSIGPIRRKLKSSDQVGADCLLFWGATNY